MKKRIGTKTYDTDKAVLVDTLDDGIQVYRKKNSPQFFLYNPNGKKGPEMFFELPPEDTEKYLTVSESRKVRGSKSKIQFSDYDQSRIRILATKQGMSMSQFLLMLVDEYENKDRNK